MSELARFSVSLENDLLAAFDDLCARRSFANRSEALRHLIHAELDRARCDDPDAAVAGVLSLLFDHHDTDLQKRLTSLQHDAGENVLATLHIHLDHDRCLEIMTLKGQSKAVRLLAEKLSASKGILQSQLSLTAATHRD